MNAIRLACILLSCFLLNACVGLWPHVEKRHGRSSNLVEFLYPGGEVPPEHEERVPHLNLPIDVGLAFLPGGYHDALTELDKAEALQRVREAFDDRDYIRNITVIPTTYVRSVNGTGGVAQLGRTFGVDVVALVAYDQVAASDERDSSIFYWTIVGAYVIKGNHHEVQTFVDTAVIDVRTSKLLLRAPGSSVKSGNATLSDSRRDLAARQSDGFDEAVDVMIANLGLELGRFEERLKNGGDDRVRVAWRDGGGGAVALPLLLLCAVRLLRRRGAPRRPQSGRSRAA